MGGPIDPLHIWPKAWVPEGTNLAWTHREIDSHKSGPSPRGLCDSPTRAGANLQDDILQDSSGYLPQSHAALGFGLGKAMAHGEDTGQEGAGPGNAYSPESRSEISFEDISECSREAQIETDTTPGPEGRSGRPAENSRDMSGMVHDPTPARLEVIQMNVTAMSDRVLKYIISKATQDVICIQEHRMHQGRFDTVVKKLSRYYKVVVTHAPIKHTKPQGGVMVLTRKGIATVAYKGLLEPSDSGFWCYEIVRCKGYDLAIVSVYMLPDDEERNTQTRLELTRFLSGYRGPYLLLGDWNKEPDELHSSGWEVPGQSQFATPGPGRITCRSGHGSQLDYGIVSHSVMHGLVTMVDHSVPIRPHFAVVHKVRADLCYIKTEQLIRPGKYRPSKEEIKANKHQQFDWATATRIAQEVTKAPKRNIAVLSTEHSMNLGDPKISIELSDQYSRWATTAEVQLLSLSTHSPKLMRPYVGTGIPHKLMWLPVVRKQPPEYLYADDDLCFLHHLLGLLEAARVARRRDHQAESDKLIKSIARLQTPPNLLDQNGTNISKRVRGWCTYSNRLGEPQMAKAIEIINQAILARAKQVGVLAETSYRQWVTEALEKGAGPAHAWTRQTERAPPLPEVIDDGHTYLVDPVDKAVYYAEYWEGSVSYTHLTLPTKA